MSDDHAYALAKCIHADPAAANEWSGVPVPLAETGKLAIGTLTTQPAKNAAKDVIHGLSNALIRFGKQLLDSRARCAALEAGAAAVGSPLATRLQEVDARLAEQRAAMQQMQDDAAAQRAALLEQQAALAASIQELSSKLAAPIPETAPAQARATGYRAALQQNAAAEQNAAAARAQAARDNAHPRPRAPQPQRAAYAPAPAADQMRIRMLPSRSPATGDWELPVNDSDAQAAAEQLMEALRLRNSALVGAYLQRSKPQAGQRARPAVALVLTLTRPGARDMLRLAREVEEKRPAALRGATVMPHLSSQELANRKALWAQCGTELKAAEAREQRFQFFNNSRSVRIFGGPVYHLQTNADRPAMGAGEPDLQLGGEALRALRALDDALDGAAATAATQPPGVEIATT
jgi:hypothetical protein